MLLHHHQKEKNPEAELISDFFCTNVRANSEEFKCQNDVYLKVTRLERLYIMQTNYPNTYTFSFLKNYFIKVSHCLQLPDLSIIRKHFKIVPTKNIGAT